MGIGGESGEQLLGVGARRRRYVSPRRNGQRAIKLFSGEMKERLRGQAAHRRAVSELGWPGPRTSLRIALIISGGEEGAGMLAGMGGEGGGVVRAGERTASAMVN